ncbi:hypothetical protein Mkiyose1665_42750 [Mycobacterium kiyosense]|uniref:Uncharacterized protein n=1 Tax=Mycobacterium kiyosense TaxID=2871094 RepID=A0A9P3Q6T6_9MYCO|nr:hypothetical protein MKCMC460_01160 [Mycobacterium sp. 20KCMC460]GLB96862.1 hypothetical protein SRL2020226_36380 [Mycobacterium kiyosense]GLC21773.1 hypothetical protein SRL2020472_43440 [Mycobacterium kiyosense]GLD01365.1 hypothetical protein Mkiyose1088_32310 [Mycobacterium kiyosense]GLD07614.1 hypothetical protein Mkiyose1383_39400 [Mycobacterium kiyosense]
MRVGALARFAAQRQRVPDQKQLHAASLAWRQSGPPNTVENAILRMESEVCDHDRCATGTEGDPA